MHARTISVVIFLILFLGVWSTAVPESYSELMQTMGTFRESRVLLTAVELDIFTAVGTGASASQVASKLAANPRSTESLLNALVAMGALTKKDEIFHNTPDTARYLVAGSPEYARPALMHTVRMWTSWSKLTDSVRQGTAAVAPAVETGDQDWTESFIAAMHRGAEGTAARLVEAVGASGVRRLLDVGGGSGAYSIAFAKANRDLRAEVLDLASVVPIAGKHIAEAGLSDRVITRVGDLRQDEFGKDYDLILLSAICHMLGPEENQDLFSRCYRALARDGRLVIRDFILEPDKTAPKSAALFALHMLVNTENGSTYTEQEYRRWLASAGFQETKRLDPSGDLIVATRR
jgi:predicted O-methyltransferase YrrM